MSAHSTPAVLRHARLPAWLLAEDWPHTAARPALARIELAQGRVRSVTPEDDRAPEPGAWHLHGALVLPGLVDAHVHLDKTFTLARIPEVRPGLLGAIEASVADMARWTPEDIHARASQGLQWAWEAGTTLLRTHVNWPEIGPLPCAWPVLDRLAHDWADRLTLQLVSLTKLDSFVDPAAARTVAAQVKATGAHALMGGFVHSTNWNAQAMRHLLQAAQAQDLDVDLHVDEELHPTAEGLLGTARIARELGFAGRIVCGHVCALAAMPESRALAILDEVARAPITLVSLPITNLLLQDARTGRTPRQRGLTLVKEARARGIALLFASDNVQDPFCPVGSYDPLEGMAAAVLAGQLDAPFDRWSDTLCRADFLARGTPGAPQLAGQPADLLIFPQADASAWPSRSGTRVVLRTGVAHGAPPAAWLASTTTATA
ncbi:amidohydrolase family protein [uncultured Pseudacidovorax sp.]|uniref:amidohydrolase family protein n=1 Tax=uncultured Pseudacidovorax sp. TaxID=679313 RepID=UPI0025DCFB8F|nr:amidohydrolase family protein [uncultured Pseudacidovorax sp.]